MYYVYGIGFDHIERFYGRNSYYINPNENFEKNTKNLLSIVLNKIEND